jgi:hypothetical protein
MKGTRTYNSLIFLTTLSIYLGLVAVGSSPAVLAYAATTPRFEIRTEAETEDDLDKKPNDDAAVLATYFDNLAGLIDELVALESSGQFDSGSENFFARYGQSVTCGLEPERQETTVGQTIENRAVQSALAGILKRFDDAFNAGECGVSEGTSQIGERRSEFTVKVENGTYEFGFNFTKRTRPDAAAFIARFAGDVSASSAGESKTRELIRRNSVFHQENNQIFIITRLPRAGL